MRMPVRLLMECKQVESGERKRSGSCGSGAANAEQATAMVKKILRSTRRNKTGSARLLPLLFVPNTTNNNNNKGVWSGGGVCGCWALAFPINCGKWLVEAPPFFHSRHKEASSNLRCLVGVCVCVCVCACACEFECECECECECESECECECECGCEVECEGSAR